MPNDSRLKALFVTFLALLAGAGVYVVVEDFGADHPPGTPRRTITVKIAHVDGADADARRDDPIRLDPSAQAGLDRIESGETATELDTPLKAPGDKPETIPGPLAADSIPGCRTAFVRNQSRRKAALRYIIWHQTVSRENGWSSQNALTARANDPKAGVSWTAVIGRSQGRCSYNVPLLQKAWHAANANSVSAGIEVEAYGDEGAYVVGAGKAKLLAVTRYISRRFSIPMTHGIIRWKADCTPIVVKPGILEHKELGPCGGGHVDVTLTTSIQELALIHQAAQGAAQPVTDTDRTTCRKLTWWRAHGRPHGAPERNAIRRRRALEHRHVTCTSRGPVRR